MRYLRMLSNSILAGGLGAAYLVVLVLQLNPHVPLSLPGLGWLFLTFAGSYGIHLAAFFYALIVVRQVFAAQVSSPGWISVSMLAWLSALAAGAAAWLMWMNLRTLLPMLEAGTGRRMATGAAILGGFALAFLALALVSVIQGRRGRGFRAALLTAGVAASIVLPAWARGPGVPRPLGARSLGASARLTTAAPDRRVVMILLDGASLDFISTATTEGRLPNFGKILDGGAAMHLATVRPTQPGPVWTAVATGKRPPKNGVRSAATYVAHPGTDAVEMLPDFCFSHALVRFGFLAELPQTSAAVTARPLWQILSDLGLDVGVVGWPLTRPVRPVRGYLVSDEFHRSGVASLDLEDVPVMYPPQLVPEARAAAAVTDETSVADTQMVVPALRDGRTLAESEAMTLDRLYERVAMALAGDVQPSFTALRLRGLDTIGHYYLRYAMPHAFGDVSEDERARYGPVLTSAYAVVDEAVGRQLAGLRPGDLLLVVSGFGMEPLSPGKRLLERVLGNGELSGSHESAPDGFLLAYGTDVKPGRFQRASVFDVVPTILYFLGFPVARDMDGYARTDIFVRAITGERPITFIPTYER